jgi:type I restriction enzyme S subunit
VASTGFAAIRAPTDEAAGLVWHCLRTNLVRRQFHAKVTGSSYPAVNEADIGDLWLPKPCTAALRKVLAATDALDLAIESTDSLIAAKREQKRGLMQQLLTGKVRFPGFTEPWKAVRLGDLGAIRSGGTPSTATAEHWGGPHAWCTPTDVTALRTRHLSTTGRTLTDSGLSESAAEVLPPNSVIVCTRATIGIAAINTVPMATNQGFKTIVPNRDVDCDFLYYAILNAKAELVRRAAGSTFTEVSLSAFRDIPIAWPSSTEEQRRIGAALACVDTEIALIASQRDAFANQRRGLMERLLSGEIDIPSSDTSAA